MSASRELHRLDDGVVLWVSLRSAHPTRFFERRVLTMSLPKPVSPSERIEAIDVLRGVALLGILTINLVTEFRVSIFEQFVPGAGATYPVDRAIETFLTLAVQMKAFALFSLLFGVGLAIQFDRLAGNAQRTRLLVRRLAVLLAIGFAHLFLIWNGDILTEYALAGFIVLPFLFGPSWLLAASGLSFLALYLVMPQVSPIAAVPDAGWMMQHVAEARRIYGNGGFLDILAFRIGEVPAILPLHVYVFPRTVAMFLLGAFVWRAGILTAPSKGRPLLAGIALMAITAGAALTLAAAGPALFRTASLGRAHFPAEALGAVVLAFGYGAAVIAVATLPAGRRMLGWASPVGRMAFTNYLAQSVILGLIFYGYGLGLFGRMGAAPALLLAVSIYAVQVVFSRWWLRRFYYGPLEWLWRRLMYGLPQPMRRTEGARGHAQSA